MNTIYTEYISAKGKKKTYYLRGWLEYELTETEKDKTIVFSAGYEVQKTKYKSKTLSIDVTDSFGNKFVKEGKLKGTSTTESVTFIDDATITWEKTYETQNISLDFLGTFGTSVFSKFQLTMSLPIVIPGKGKPSVSITARRDDNTTATLTLDIRTGTTETTTIPLPTIKKNGASITPTWYYTDGSQASFPISLSANQLTVTASDTVDPMHGFAYTYEGTIRDIPLTDASAIDYVYQPEWKPPSTYTVDDEPAVLVEGNLPEMNYLNNAAIDVYAMDYVQTAIEGHDVYTLLPNDDGWKIEVVDSTHWKLPITLSEQYVSSPTTQSGSAKIYIEYKTISAADKVDKIAIFNTTRNCNFTTGLANNVFIGGCTLNDYSSRVWYSAVNNPLYMPDTNYIEVGSNDTRVMGLVKVGDYLGVIKQSETIDSSVFLVYPTSFDDETTFATKSCVSGVGALGQYCFNVLGDETLFLSPDGIMAIEPNDDEQSRIKDRSYFINGRLLEEPELENAYSFVYKGLYLLAVNNHVYVLDGSQRNSWGNQKTNLVYECYFLDNVPAKCLFQYSGDLWFADDKGNLCRFKDPTDENAYSDNGEAVRAVWSTVADDDGSLHYLKNLTKKGCLVSLLPEIGTTARVYLKKDENDPILVKESAPLPDGKMLPSSVFTKKKIKKYTRLQFIIEDVTDNPFGVNKIIKSYTVGNYAKK